MRLRGSICSDKGVLCLQGLVRGHAQGWPGEVQRAAIVSLRLVPTSAYTMIHIS